MWKQRAWHAEAHHWVKTSTPDYISKRSPKLHQNSVHYHPMATSVSQGMAMQHSSCFTDARHFKLQPHGQL